MKPSAPEKPARPSATQPATFSPYVPPVDPPRKNKPALVISAILVGVWIIVLLLLALNS